VRKEDQLIYDLIFSEKCDFKIDISDYVDDIYEYSEFVSKIKSILKKSKVMIIENLIIRDSKTVIWNLKVRK
jgi:hypothetical protein